MWASFKLIIKATPPDGLTDALEGQPKGWAEREVEREGRGGAGKSSLRDGQSGACLPNCASFIYNNYNCKKFEQSSWPKAAQLTDSQGRGRMEEGSGGVVES